MGCLSHRRKQTQEFTDHKWDYITLADFKAKGCGAGFFYGYLWFSLTLSIAVYSVDSFTAVNLLAFNRWSSKIEPAIPISVSKWIFSGCIIASFVNLGFEGIRATRVMKRRNVAECYMDSLAARWESIRLGSGQGWRRFLVFTELTKSNKGAEYIALFTYFSFQSWIRVILCSGPRQVVNGFTLKSVYEAKLAPTATSVDGAILGFFDKIRALATEDYQQAVILSGMCFTLVVWVFSALYLLSAVLFYVFFLFHWIPRADGGLTGYCERKVNKRLTSIVTKKVNKALAKGQAKRERADALAMKNGEKPQLERAATLPTLPDVGGPGKEDSLLEMPVLGRSETTTTLPVYSSRPGTPNSFELRAMDQKRPIQSRTGTSGSTPSYSSRAPLLGAAADMGYGRASPEPSLTDVNFGAMPPQQPGTSNSQRSYGPRPGYGRMNGNSTSSSLRNPVTASPAPTDTDTVPPFSGPSRTPTAHSLNAYGLSNSGSGPPPSTRSSTIMPSRLSTFHEGESAVRQMLKVPPSENPTSPGLPAPYAMRVQQSPLVALGTLDAQGRPWTTVWGGERGFAGPVAQGVLGFSSDVDTRHDPVFGALWEGAGEDGLVQPGGGRGKMMAALAIDLETRDRVKLAGVMMAGSAKEEAVQAAMAVTESLGNCPKYLNKKDVRRHSPAGARLVSEGLPLPEEALALVDKADMFFLSSTNGETMDTNHRGGTQGFVRVVRNDEEDVVLVYPEYSGNRLYQTLGNLRVNPLIGIVVPDYDTSDVLYLTGSSSILVGHDASSLIARTNLAVKITVTSARFVKAGLPFQGTLGEPSPYNPPLRHLLAEKDPHVADPSARPEVTASLVKREMITPTISTLTFELSSARGQPLPRWQAGQHLTLDFEPELGAGYSHMRDEDPQSLNDDYVRTFTVSSEPEPRGQQLQITVRRHGPATGLLWRHNVRAPLDLPVLGFGGEEAFRLPTVAEASTRPVFVAGGVGATPLMAQARAVLDAGVDLSVLWSLRGEDVALAVHAFAKTPRLAAVTRLFITGQADTSLLDKLHGLGAAALERRRMRAGDVAGLKGQGRKFYLCAGPGLLGPLNGWLDGERVVSEDFGY
ncbi:Uncharacterized protein TPAR_01325 [Tolypocladium paradoxum]|uniref:FAD-binding FR-type domain-containing protein n=1 Tax=Tolypocladium paradoxum TaxID=94208 RepID=A0A2S4L7Q1_9HYPO|nr:Uncharacterized protein TPAR_01325 [Tolypocladium paradoxum]